MWYFVAGSVFLLLSIIWWFIQNQAKKNKKYEEAMADVKKSIDEHNFRGIVDGVRRMRDAR